VPKPSKPFHIRDMEIDDRPAVVSLAASLSEFFPEDVVQAVADSLDKRPALVGVLGEEIVGFLVYTVRDGVTAEIMWIGVAEQYHGLGLGSLLLDTLEASLEKRGIRKLVASTLSYTVQYKPFEKVRTFYYHRGFNSLGVQQDYYDDGMDRLLLMKELD
jgi:ribosomal protein S18 acetylase RimI-like enzyme